MNWRLAVLLLAAALSAACSSVITGTPSQDNAIPNAREMSGFCLCPGLLVGGHVE